MAEVGDDRSWRIAYDEGVLELRMPLTEHESSSLNKFTIYASLGVPELWRYRRQTLQYQLVGANYEISTKSLAFPFLPITEVPGFIEQSKTIGQRAAVRLFRTRIREILHA